MTCRMVPSLPSSSDCRHSSTPWVLWAASPSLKVFREARSSIPVARSSRPSFFRTRSRASSLPGSKSLARSIFVARPHPERVDQCRDVVLALVRHLDHRDHLLLDVLGRGGGPSVPRNRRTGIIRTRCSAAVAVARKTVGTLRRRDRARARRRTGRAALGVPGEVPRAARPCRRRTSRRPGWPATAHGRSSTSEGRPVRAKDVPVLATLDPAGADAVALSAAPAGRSTSRRSRPGPASRRSTWSPAGRDRAGGARRGARGLLGRRPARQLAC